VRPSRTQGLLCGQRQSLLCLLPAQARGPDIRQQIVGVHSRVQRGHQPHLGELGHRLPISQHRLHGHCAGVGAAVAQVPSAHREACRQPLDVVLERPWQGLVEIVHVEQQEALGRGEPAKVRQMSVAAQLHLQAGRWRFRQIGRHDLRCAPVKRERRDHHASVPNRDQIWFPVGVLCLQQCDRVRTIRGRHPVPMTFPWRLLARRFALCSPLVGA
jgi:hypothetical protein